MSFSEEERYLSYRRTLAIQRENLEMHTDPSKFADGYCPTEATDSAFLHDEKEENPSIDSTKTLREFGLFSKLRPEIRIQIWKHAAMNQEAQIVEVYPCRDKVNHRICELYLWHPMPKIDGLNGSYHVQYRKESQLSALALASTNIESRREVQRYLGTITCRPSNPDSNPETIYYNLELDTVAIRYHDLDTWQREKSSSIHGLDKIRKLLILHRCCLCGPHSAKLSAVELSTLLAPLSSLSELYIEFDISGPKSGIIKRINPSEAKEHPESLIGELRQQFKAKKQQILEDRKQKGGSAIKVMELVTCQRQQ